MKLSFAKILRNLGMCDEYKHRRVGDLIADGLLAINDGYRMRNLELGTTGIPFVRGGDIKEGDVHHEVNDHIRPEFASRISKKRTLPWDVAFITKGTVGRVGILRPEQPSVVFAPQVAYWRSLDHEKLWPRFIYYLLCGSEFQACLDADKTHGSMVADYVSISQQHNFSLPIPPITRQREIAGILGSLDDKIKLNRRIGKTLEAIVRALFNSWFINFDPVIDNALSAGNAIPEPLQRRAAARQALGDARKPLPEKIRREFPNEFEFRDEMGWVPQGWEVGMLADVLVLQRGFDLPSRSRTPGKFPLAASSGQDGTHNESRVDGPGVVTGRSGKIGVVSLYLNSHWPLNTTLWVRKYFRSNPYHAYFLLKKLDLERFATGSAVPTLNRNHVHSVPQILVPEALLKAFEVRASTIYSRIELGTAQQACLSALRDTLLPKLLSGELTIPAAEKLAADVL